jgi:hypothetical protein
MNADIKVSYKNNQTMLWGYYVTLGEELHTIKRLMISSIGMYGNTESVAEGYIDNVELSTMREIIPVPTTAAPLITTPVTTATTVRATTTAAPTKSPGTPVTFLLAVGVAGITALILYRKN